MDLLLYILVVVMGTVPPFIVGWALYRYGRKQGEMQYTMAKEEIRLYIKGEFLSDLTTAVQHELAGINITEAVHNGIRSALGLIGQAGSIEGKLAAAQYAQQNPGIASLLTSVAARGASRWLGKQMGVPKDVVDSLAIGGIQFPGIGSRQRKSDDLAPVVPAGPQ
jgi:hypothetical protein